MFKIPRSHLISLLRKKASELLKKENEFKDVVRNTTGIDSIFDQIDSNANKSQSSNAQEISGQLASMLNDATLPKIFSHAYSSERHIFPFGAYLIENSLALPVFDMNGHLMNIQLISPIGIKEFVIDDAASPGFIYVREGAYLFSNFVVCLDWETACTISTHYLDEHIITAVNSEDIFGIASLIKSIQPDSQIIFAAERNSEQCPSYKAAKVFGGKVATTEWPSDAPHYLNSINDLHTWKLSSCSPVKNFH